MVHNNNNSEVLDQKAEPESMGEVRPTYALEHLATFKLKTEAELTQPRKKIELLSELYKSGGVWPQKMYMNFNGQWLVMLDAEKREIENFPCALITEPTAFISTDPLEVYNNLLLFSIPGIELGNTEMHIFQVTEVSAMALVEDLKQLASGKPVTIDRNRTPIRLPKHNHSGQQKLPKDKYGIAAAVEKSAHQNAQTERDVLVLNHCFEDIERFIARLQYAAEALHEYELRKNEHNPHGEGLLIMRSRPPLESEFGDIFAKIKLALNFIVKLQEKFPNLQEPVRNIFKSLNTITNICNSVYARKAVAERVVNPLLRPETVAFLSASLPTVENQFWHSLGRNWTVPKNQFKNHKGCFHPIFYDEWSPDWIVDEDIPYVLDTCANAVSLTPPPNRKHLVGNSTWLVRLESRNVKIAEVIYDKTANTDKELIVATGEFLEILDDSRKWWKARNATGNIGYVPHTVLRPYNFENGFNDYAKDTDSVLSSYTEIDNRNVMQKSHNHNTFSAYVPPGPAQEQALREAVKGMNRSESMPNVPVPPPLPPPVDSQTNTPAGTLKRNTAQRALVAMRSRNDCEANVETNDKAFELQSSINDELRLTLQQRKRKDLEILKTPEIYINQNSACKEVENWLREKGFSDVIVQKLHTLTGAQLFALRPHQIEDYFGRKDSRRLISQIILQKNICEYKTIRSSELSAKLARARQKADQEGVDPNEIF